MAKENVHEMKAQDNGQAAKDATEILRSEAWSSGEELSQLSSKLDLLADVNFSEMSFQGESGIVYFLRDIADNLRAMQDRLQEASKGSRENQ